MAIYGKQHNIINQLPIITTIVAGKILLLLSTEMYILCLSFCMYVYILLGYIIRYETVVWKKDYLEIWDFCYIILKFLEICVTLKFN